MKHLRLSFAAGILTVAFAVSTAIAGQMPTGITAPPPTAEASVAGNMPTGVTSAIDPLTGFTLSLLQSVLSLF